MTIDSLSASRAYTQAAVKIAQDATGAKDTKAESAGQNFGARNARRASRSAAESVWYRCSRNDSRSKSSSRIPRRHCHFSSECRISLSV